MTGGSRDRAGVRGIYSVVSGTAVNGQDPAVAGSLPSPQLVPGFWTSHAGPAAKAFDCTRSVNHMDPADSLAPSAGSA